MNRLMNIDRRIIFLFVLLGAVLPLLVGFELPIKPTPNVQSIYDTVEAVAQKNGRILIAFDYGPSLVAELRPMALALLRHCFQRGVKVVGVTLTPEGVGMAQDAFETVAKEFNREYGKDYAFMGFKAGVASFILNMGQDFQATLPKDIQGNDTKAMEITKDIRSLRDFDYVVDITGSGVAEAWIAYGQERYRFKMATACTAVMAPDQFPFLQAGQINGLMGGLAGAAEYETLVGRKDAATRNMQPQSAVHLVIILFILFGNLFYFLGRRTP
ncbi:MAG: hypothetical protein A3F84_17835 [Candidatus Handelsmanbacteria bacterium RIFCSPLOWO2_12_FULL_64_10]|uniref:Uncharacterized protein n=1 Tax=Handelsmanbacteria sp. (strain RIFCSPLOWO2_12_FULL_64_10) TaxID=1817868 RepID=A0A1F6CN17_HANXR|nr:MAG: hypothetical protein A3F84_17835 [Candidatus Handelsmanbacteria bacterium RIFCSPLOWO2_12_FULL_64_10]